MRLPLILALLALSASSYADATAPLPQVGDPAQEARPEPAPQLMHLERALMQKQEARDKGELPPEKYQEFVAAFRVELEAVMGRISPTAENKGLHAQILARLGPQEQGQALASLEQALAEDPESPALLVAKGSILYEQRDFQTADALALQAWEASGRNDPRAWALHKMSEGRVSGVSSGEPAPRLRPASDFARLDWSIPERHDINEQGLGYLRQATKAFYAGDTAAARMYTQAAMNADPTSKSMQDLYQHAQANFAKRDEIGSYLNQALAAKEARRYQDSLVWMQKAYDAFPNDKAYEALQVARQRASEDAARRSTTPAKAPLRKGDSPLVPLALTFGLPLVAFGVHRGMKQAYASDGGLNPSPNVPPDNESRNWMASAKVAGVLFVALATWEFGGPIFAGARAFFATLAPSASAGAGTGMATATATAVTAEEAIKLGLPVAVGVYGAKKTAEDLYSKSSSQGQSGSSTADPPRGESSSANAQDNLNRKLRGLEDAQKDAVEVRKLPDGRVRYYEADTPSRNAGPTRGARFVTEFDPKSGQVRQWMESYDHGGNVVRVHPKTINGQVVDSPHFPPTGKELAP